MCAVAGMIPASASAGPADGTTTPTAVAAPPAEAPPAEAPPAEPTGAATQPPAPANLPEPPTTAEAATATAHAPGPPAAETISPDMLDAGQPNAAPPAATAAKAAPVVTSAPSAADEEEMELEAELRSADRFHPTTNPGRLSLVARGMFANAGSGSLPGGRFGGVSIDLGQSWNRFGYAVTASALGGRFGLSQSGTREINGLIGVGPTVGLGRLAIIGNGFLDLRVGYDIFYGVMNRRDTSTNVSTNSFDLSPSKSVIPHGPRVRVDLGLMSQDASRRRFHGCGLSMGYQALVGSARGPMPTTHMLTFGIVYWMG